MQRAEGHARFGGYTVTAADLARRVSEAAVNYQTTRDPEAVRELEKLAIAAAERVQRVGEGTVDHIVLSSILRLVVLEAPHLDQVLADAGWTWLE